MTKRGWSKPPDDDADHLFVKFGATNDQDGIAVLEEGVGAGEYDIASSLEGKDEGLAWQFKLSERFADAVFSFYGEFQYFGLAAFESSEGGDFSFS